MDAGNIDHCHTITVALELDDGTPEINIAETYNDGAATTESESTPTINDGVELAESSNFLKIGPRTLPTEAYPRIDDASLKLCDLSVEAMRLLELRLNPYAIGTLKNWEFVCAQLGASIDEIANLRGASSPTAKMLHMFKDVDIKHFLDVLCMMNRVDILISISKFIEKIKLNPNKGDQRYSQTETTAFVTGILDNDTDYVLLLHYESSKEAKINFKHLRKNLRHQCKVEGSQPNGKQLEITDINNCIDEFNIYDTGQQVFDRARSVLVVFNDDYIREVVNCDPERSNNLGNSSKEILLSLKIFLHRLTNNEYIRNGMRNKRFRAVLMSKFLCNPMPIGWPSNTLAYRFPEDYQPLCRKLFGTTQLATNTNTTGAILVHNDEKS